MTAFEWAALSCLALAAACFCKGAFGLDFAAVIWMFLFIVFGAAGLFVGGLAMLVRYSS